MGDQSSGTFSLSRHIKEVPVVRKYVYVINIKLILPLPTDCFLLNPKYGHTVALTEWAIREHT